MDLIAELNREALEKELPKVAVGDTVRVHVKVKEGSRERIQVFEGIVIARKHGGIGETITVRRISYGVGVEKVFPLSTPFRSCVGASCAAPSSTICADASANAPRLRRNSNRRNDASKVPPHTGGRIARNGRDRREAFPPLSFLKFPRGRFRVRR